MKFPLTQPQDGPPAARGEGQASASYAESLSPSLASGGPASYEMKFRVSEALAQQVERWAGEHLALDVHADAALGNAYRIHSLYLDTDALDVFRRAPTFARRKFRVRRYGSEHGVYLERKTRSGDRVRKRRTLVHETDLTRFGHHAADPTWGAFWFHRRVLDRRFRPTCHISYERVAYVGACPEGPMRLTLDRRIHGAPASSWEVAPVSGGLPLLSDAVILELKYRDFLPALFKRLVWELNLTPAPASKYRSCVESWALDRRAREVG